MSILSGPALSIISASAGTNLPFTFGHAFKKGDIPAGQTLQSPSVSNFQCVIKNAWPDGSAKFAILSGQATLSANTALPVTLDTTASGVLTGLTTANLKATDITVALAATDGKDWTFGTAAHTVGELITMSHVLDTIVSGTVTVDNSATAGSTTTQKVSNTVRVTASISGGTVGGLQTSRATLLYRHGRNITAITKAANARIDFDQAMTVQVGDTLDLAGIGGMTQFNGTSPTVVTVDPSLTWVTVNVDSTGFTTFTSGGTAISSRSNSTYKETSAYVRAGGGIEWNGTTANTYASDNTGLFVAGASWATTDWDSPFANPVSGPTMTSWIYRKPVGTDPHLVAWLEVRLYSSGAVEVLPWLENGYLKVAGLTSKQATYALTIGGTQVFSLLFDVKHHSRAPLINDAKVSYWFNAGGSDPIVNPVHSQSYMELTELVPTYSASITGSATVMTIMPTTFTPYQIGNLIYDSDSMASTGYQRPIGLLPEHEVAHLVCPTSLIPTVYLGIQRNAYSTGRYCIHYRDESTNKPLRFSQYPTLVISSNQGFKDNGSSTASNNTTFGTGGGVAGWDVAHSPSIGYYAYLLTGRYYFLEQCLFAATVNFLGNGNNSILRDGAKCLMRPCYGAWQTRSTAWQLRTHVQALTILPDTDTTMRTEFIDTLNNNIDWFYQKYVQQKNNPFGCIVPGETYGPMGIVSAWQQDFITAAFGYALCLDLPISAKQTNRMARFFQWKAKFIVGRLGSFAGGGYPYVNADVYKLKLSDATVPDFDTGAGPWYSSWDQVWANQSLALTTSPYSPDTWLKQADGVLGGEIMPGARSHWGNLMPAISYAIRLGVPGATEGLARVQSASNYSALATEFNTFPVWSVTPPAIAASAPPLLDYTGSTTRIRKPAEFVGKTHVGTRGSGVLGATIKTNTATGTNGAGALYPQLPDSSDDTVEISLQVTQQPASGKLLVYNDGSYVHSGAADGDWPWTAQLYRQGQTFGSPITVTDTFGSGGQQQSGPYAGAITRGNTLPGGTAFSSAPAGTFSVSNLTKAVTAVTGTFTAVQAGTFSSSSLARTATAVSGSFVALAQDSFLGNVVRASTLPLGSWISVAPDTFLATITRGNTLAAGDFTAVEPNVFTGTFTRANTGVGGSGFIASIPTFTGVLGRRATTIGGLFYSNAPSNYINASKTGLENLIALINSDNAKAGTPTNYTASQFRVRLVVESSDEEWNTQVTLEAASGSGFSGVYDVLLNRLPLGATVANPPSHSYAAVYGETRSQVITRVLSMFAISAAEVDTSWVDQGAWNTSATHTLTITPKNGDLNLLYLPGTTLMITVTTTGP